MVSLHIEDEETTYDRFGISHFQFMLSFRGKVRGQLVLCGRNVLQPTRGCQLLLSPHFLYASSHHHRQHSYIPERKKTHSVHHAVQLSCSAIPQSPIYAPLRPTLPPFWPDQPKISVASWLPTLR